MKGLTDVDGGFFSRRGLSRTRYAFQEERPQGAFFYLAASGFFGYMATSPFSARVVSGIVCLICFWASVAWTVHSSRAVLRAYRRDVDERKKRLIREVMES